MPRSKRVIFYIKIIIFIIFYITVTMLRFEETFKYDLSYMYCKDVLYE